MSMFKKIWDKLFVEEDGEDEEIYSGELVDLVMEEPDNSAKEARKEKRRLEKEQKRQAELERKAEMERQAEAERLAAQQQAELERQAEQQKQLEAQPKVDEVSVAVEKVEEEVDRFVNIEFEKVTPIRKPARKPFAQPALKRNDEVNDYVYVPVISPYFGQSEKETKKAKDAKKATVIMPPKKKKENDTFGRVISPFYGNNNNVVEIKKEVKKAKPVVAPIESEPEVNYVVNDDLEERSMTLAEIIGKEEKGDIEQISLFGEGELLDKLVNAKGDE